MILAKVIGRVISNQKTPELRGAKLLIVNKVDKYQKEIEDATYVAIDKVGAGQGDVVLVGDSYSTDTSDNIKQAKQDMSIVAIVENIEI